MLYATNARRLCFINTGFFVVSAWLVGMVVGSAVTLAVLNVQRAIPSSGLVVAVNVGVYSDVACTLNLTSIDWGNVYPGGFCVADDLREEHWDRLRQSRLETLKR